MQSEWPVLLDQRIQLYRFLGRLFLAEVDQALLDRLRGVSAADAPPTLSEGFTLIETGLRETRADVLTDLAVDYARIFLGAGLAREARAAYPYASVYTSRDGLIMQDARDQVLAAYRAKGLDPEGVFNLPEDHIALEFEFMATLCEEAREALDRDDQPGFEASLVEQGDFLTDHLEIWVQRFLKDVVQCAGTTFYRGVGTLAAAFLETERGLLLACGPAAGS